MPQQTIYSNVQHYLTDTDHQDIYTANAGNNTDIEIFDEPEDLKKQKRKSRSRKDDSQSTWRSIWKSLAAPNVNIDRLPQKAEIAYKNDKVEKALNIYTQILQADPANYVMLCNRAMVKLKMRKFKEALFDIETALEVDKVYNDAWYLSLIAHVGLENKIKVEQDIGNIKHPDMQWN